MSETGPARKRPPRLGYALVIAGTVLISVLHHAVPSSQEHWHNVFQHLYYVPTVTAALVFGWRGGLLAGLLAGLTHLPDMLINESPDYAIEQMIEIPVLCLVGILTGYFSDRDRKQRKDLKKTTTRLTEVYRELQQNFEQMKRAERLFAVGQLAAGMAHEIRNPLGSIAGAAGILQRNSHLEPKHLECLEIINKESQRLNRLLTEFLDFARPRPPKYQVIEIASLLNSVVQLAAHGVGRDTITLRTEVAPGLPTFEGDPEMLKQMLLNLIINSIQATPDGGEVVVSAAHQEGQILIGVRDNGCGIAPECRDKIFDPFFTTKEGGTGLGLPVAHQIVEQHGGILRAAGNPEAGMTFSALLPIQHEATP